VCFSGHDLDFAARRGSWICSKGFSTVPNPKRRHSKARTSKRRAHDFLTATGVSECPNCHERKLPHHACAKCGMYKGRAVLETKEAG
jgi:large subunit ribosomal protein L32